MMEFALQPLVSGWASRGFGFALEDDSENALRLTHVVWADTITIFATDALQFQIMTQELTNAIHGLGFCWKVLSMEYILWGFVSSPNLHPAPALLAPEAMTFKVIEHMIILGVLYDTKASTEASMEYRLQKGQACFWKPFKALSILGSVQGKVRGWSEALATSALCGCSPLHVTKGLLVGVRRWELALLRRMS